MKALLDVTMDCGISYRTKKYTIPMQPIKVAGL
jgi:hypothetical protein